MKVKNGEPQPVAWASARASQRLVRAKAHTTKTDKRSARSKPNCHEPSDSSELSSASRGLLQFGYPLAEREGYFDQRQSLAEVIDRPCLRVKIFRLARLYFRLQSSHVPKVAIDFSRSAGDVEKNDTLLKSVEPSAFWIIQRRDSGAVR